MLNVIRYFIFCYVISTYIRLKTIGYFTKMNPSPLMNVVRDAWKDLDALIST